MTSGFERTARVVSGTTPSRLTVQPYRVQVSDGRLVLRPADRDGAVLDVALDRVSARPVGRAGAVRVEVDGTPVLVDLTDRYDAQVRQPVWGFLSIHNAGRFCCANRVNF